MCKVKIQKKRNLVPKIVIINRCRDYKSFTKIVNFPEENQVKISRIKYDTQLPSLLS